ncbi:efflux RND transporter periplasmic adaptor subunit [Colwelliaceae bacterium 6441]
MSIQVSPKTTDTETKVNRNKKLLILLVIIAITGSLVLAITKNPPESRRFKPAKTSQMTVATKVLSLQTYPVMVESFGTVKPRTESKLFAQVSGQITQVSEQFRDGGFFDKGDILVQLDDRDLRAEVKVSQANLFSANQALLEEKARGEQAKTDWQRLGNGKKANALVLRQPQLEAAKAKVLSAQAQLDRAKLSLERTQIIAPYDGRVLKKQVDVGQLVSSNSQLASIFAVDSVEIRLPVKNKDLPLINLPEEYRDIGEKGDKNDVTLSSDLMGNQTWNGQIIRTESAIDEMSQQLYVVAQIKRPYDASASQGVPIKIGQYVTAKITGKVLNNTLVIPNRAIYQASYVYIVENGLLMRKDITIGWQNGDESIIQSGLNAGDELVLTTLGQVSSGTPVSIEKNATDLVNKQPGKSRDKNPKLTPKPNAKKMKGKSL